MGRVTLPKVARFIITSPQEVRDIVDVLARGRLHLSKGRIAIAASLIQEAENKLLALSRGDTDDH